MNNTITKLLLTGIISLGTIGTVSTMQNRPEENKVEDKQITLEEAKELAVNKVQGTVEGTSEDHDDYTIYTKSGDYIYELEIDKVSGQITEVDREKVKTTSTSKTTQTTSSALTLEEAKKIALGKVNGTVQRSEQDEDDFTFYIKKDNYIYEIEVDKRTKAVEEIDREKVKTTSTSKTTQTSSSSLTLAEAKKIALGKVNGTVQRSEQDEDDFTFYIKKGNYIYEIEVDKRNGRVEEIDKELVETKKVSLEEAKSIALKEVGGKIISTKTDDDDYEIIVQNGNYIYEVEVDRKTGRIDSIDKEKVKAAVDVISVEKAKSIALKEVAGTIKSVDYDDDDYEYSIEILKDRFEYEVKINARNGNVMEVEKDD